MYIRGRWDEGGYPLCGVYCKLLAPAVPEYVPDHVAGGWARDVGLPHTQAAVSRLALPDRDKVSRGD